MEMMMSQMIILVIINVDTFTSLNISSIQENINQTINERPSCTNDDDCSNKTTNNILDLKESIKLKCLKGHCHSYYNRSNNDHNAKYPWNKNLKNNQMLMIIIIMFIMFVGMCVALNLFSRARFKKRRGIFSNPGLLKKATNKSNALTFKGQQKQRKIHRLRSIHDKHFPPKQQHRWHNDGHQIDGHDTNDAIDNDRSEPKVMDMNIINRQDHIIDVHHQQSLD